MSYYIYMFGFRSVFTLQVCLEPTVDERVRQSSVKRRTANPFYNEYFKFPATYDDIKVHDNSQS